MIWIILGGVPLLVGIARLMCIDDDFRQMVYCILGVGFVIVCVLSIAHGISQITQ